MILELDKYILIPAIFIFCFVIPLILLFRLTQFKIVENNSNKLMFTIRPVFRLCLASFLGGIGIALAVYLLCNNFLVTLTCNKVAEETENIQCNLDTRSIVLQHQNKFIPNLLSAKLDIRDEKKEKNPFIQTILITSQEEMDIGGLFASYDVGRATEIVNDVNQFIDSPMRELKIAKDDSNQIYPLVRDASVFILLSLLVATLSSYQYCSFDSESQNFTLIRKSFFIEKILSQASFQEIETVKVETSDGEESSVQRVLLYLRSGEKLSLTGIANSYGYQNSLAKSIRKFLKESREDNNDE